MSGGVPRARGAGCNELPGPVGLIGDGRAGRLRSLSVGDFFAADHERREDGGTGRMLFHIKQSHAPQDCPYGKGGSTSLFDGESKDVKVHGYWLLKKFRLPAAHDLSGRRDRRHHAPPGVPEAGGSRHHLRDHARRRSPSAASRLSGELDLIMSCRSPTHGVPAGVRRGYRSRGIAFANDLDCNSSDSGSDSPLGCSSPL